MASPRKDNNYWRAKRAYIVIQWAQFFSTCLYVLVKAPPRVLYGNYWAPRALTVIANNGFPQFVGLQRRSLARSLPQTDAWVVG